MRAQSYLRGIVTVLAVSGLVASGCADCRATDSDVDPDTADQTESISKNESASEDPSREQKAGEQQDATPKIVRSDELPDQPERIIALAPNVTEILFALGLGDEVVAVSQHSDYPKAARDKPSVGNFQNPDYESLIAKDPDLVVGTTSGGDESIATRLREADIAFLFVRMSTIEETLSGIRTIGEAVGRGDRADELADDMTSEMTSISKDVAGDERVRVLMVYGREPIVAAGPGTFGHQLIERAGGENVLADAGAKFPRIDLEKVLQLDPDVILDAASMGQDAGTADFWSQFDSVSAVENGRVTYLTETAVMRPGPRLPEGLKIIAEAIHE